MKLSLLIFIFFLKYFGLRSQDTLSFSPSSKWVITEFYIYKPAKDDLSDEQYTPNYARAMYNSFRKVHGWQGEYLEIRSDNAIKMYITDRGGKYFAEKIYNYKNNTLFNSSDTIEVLLVSKNCIVLNIGKTIYDVYSISKTRNKINFCDCIISDIIKKKVTI
jgi:hypothetical protein